MKKIICTLAGLTLLASTALAKDLEFSIKRNGDIVMIANKESLDKNYKGDKFLGYRHENGKWVLDNITYLGSSSYKREFVRYVEEKEVPTYTKGLYSLYVDQDQDEELLVATFYEKVSKKTKDQWIETAKGYIKELNEN